MAFNAHLAELERRHQTLSREIEMAMAHPSLDPLVLVELKRKKLKLKDEISKCKAGTLVH